MDMTSSPHTDTELCLADVAAYGACILTTGHDGRHKDASGHYFEDGDGTIAGDWHSSDTTDPAVSRVSAVFLDGRGDSVLLYQSEYHAWYSREEAVRIATDLLNAVAALDGGGWVPAP